MLHHDELEQLKAHFYNCAFTKNVREYTDEVFACLAKEIHFSTASFGVTDVIITDKQECGLKLLQTYTCGLPEHASLNYEKYSNYDPFIPALAWNDRIVLDRHSHLQPYDDFQDSLIFRKHYAKYGQHHVSAVAFRIPNSNRFIFSFISREDAKDYFLAEEVAFAQAILPHVFTVLTGKFELFNYCSITEKNYISELCLRWKNLTLLQAQIIYLIVEKGITAAKAIARELNIEDSRAVNNQLNAIYTKLDVSNTPDPKMQLIRKIKGFPI